MEDLAYWHIKLKNRYISTSLNLKGKGGTLLPTSLIRRLSIMPLLKAEYTSLVSWVLITVS